MNTTNPAPGGAGQSPTGTPYLPPSWVRPLMGVYVALAGLAGYLAVFSGNPMAEKVGVVLGGILAVLGPLLGIASPGARKLATMALALGLTLTSTSATASRLTFLGTPERTLAGETPSLLDYLELGAAFGLELRLMGEDRHLDARPALQVLGGLGLADVGLVQLSVVTGGQLVLGAEGGDAAFIFGASAGWKRGPVKLGVFAGAAFRDTQSLVVGFVASG